MTMLVKITGEERARLTFSGAAIVTMRTAQRKALEREAEIVRKAMVDHLTGRKLVGKRPPKLLATTLATRRARGNNSAAPFLDSRRLLGSIVVRPAGRGATYVGVDPSAKTKSGLAMTQLAEQLEYGTTIAMQFTPAMVAKLRQMGVPESVHPSGGTGIVIIRIKPRPFLAPLNAAYNRDAGRIARVSMTIRGVMAGWW